MIELHLPGEIAICMLNSNYQYMIYTVNHGLSYMWSDSVNIIYNYKRRKLLFCVTLDVLNK